MNDSRKLLLSSVAGFIQQIVTIVCGLILPSAILKAFGSSANGLTNSICQFLGFISLCELGVGAVVQSTLYKPLTTKDTYQISCVIKSAKKFFHIVGFILLLYVGILCIFYPPMIEEYDSEYVIAMILVLSIDSFGKYYLGITNNLLLRADQKAYIPLCISTVTTLANMTTGLLFINLGASLLTVKLTTSVIYLAQPIIMALYVRKNYDIDKKVKYTGEVIKQKWNGLAQHFASVIVDHTDTVVLTVFSTLKSVSIYAVYYMVVSSIRGLINSTLSGVEAAMGNMLSKNENKLKDFFGRAEWLLHTVVTCLFSIAGVLIIPFIMIYTKGVSDTNYNAPVFAVLIVLANAGFALSSVYKQIVKAAGHYKETQTASIIEAAINVVFSIILVVRFGLIGVAIGTIAAMTYRLLYHVWYIKRNIIFRGYGHFIKHVCVDILTAAIIVISTIWIDVCKISYVQWAVSAVIVSLVAVATTILVNTVFYKHYTIEGIKNLLKKIRRT